MYNIHVKQKLRPLKICYIVRPNDRKALEKVIKVKSFLWGGLYSPVVVLYKRTPSFFKDGERPSSSKKLVEGILNFYEPDVIVTTSDIKTDELPAVNCEVITLKELMGTYAKYYEPKFGISITTVANHFYEQELKFKREDKLSLFIPAYGADENLFLKATFGDFPKEVGKNIKNSLAGLLSAKDWVVNTKNYMDAYSKASISLFRVLQNYETKIDYTGYSERDRNIILLLDQKSFVDIVDYINLRAAGYRVMPVLLEVSKENSTKKACLKYISDFAGVHIENKASKSRITVQKSRSIPEKDWKDFYSFLSPPKFPDGEPKCMMRSWMPPFWSQYHKERGYVGCSSWLVKELETEIDSDDRKIRLKTLDPDFELGYYTGGARFANDLSVKLYSSDSLEAEIYPSGSPDVARTAGMFGYRDWIIKSSGITRLCDHNNSRVYWDVVKAEDVFIGWLKSRGWQAKISDAGKVAYQMLRHLGGTFGIRLIQNQALINFITERKINDIDLASEAGTVSAKSFFGVLNEIKKNHLPSWNDENYRKKFLKYKIFQLGAELQCPICSRRSWHSISALDYNLSCPHCLDSFELPTHSPKDIAWAYKTIGPFAARGKAAGAYSVLLTSNFFTKDMALSGGATPVLSFEMQKGSRKIEVDMALFYRSNAWFDRGTELVFCECKTTGDFSKNDVEKMKLIAQEFPGSILVFSTMKEELSAQEKKLLKPFIKSCNRYFERDRPRNPVLILTANELFDDRRPPSCWKDKGGKYKFFADNHINGLLELCQATQKIYMDLDPWYAQWYKPKQRTGSAKKTVRTA